MIIPIVIMRLFQWLNICICADFETIISTSTWIWSIARVSQLSCGLPGLLKGWTYQRKITGESAGWSNNNTRWAVFSNNGWYMWQPGPLSWRKKEICWYSGLIQQIQQETSAQNQLRLPAGVNRKVGMPWNWRRTQRQGPRGMGSQAAMVNSLHHHLQTWFGTRNLSP